MTFEKILKIHPQQKAIIASGFAEDEDVQATLTMGAMVFVSKLTPLSRLPRPYTKFCFGDILFYQLIIVQASEEFIWEKKVYSLSLSCFYSPACFL
jgi:hypothetical protein